MADEDELTIEMRRVLSALCAFASESRDTLVPIRRIANDALEGDTQRAAGVLAALDARGLIRTDTMGWHRGWITEKGRGAAGLALSS